MDAAKTHESQVLAVESLMLDDDQGGGPDLGPVCACLNPDRSANCRVKGMMRMQNNDIGRLLEEKAALEARLVEAGATIRDLREKLNAALDGTGLCLWQGKPLTGELQVFNLQGFEPNDMAPHFDQWLAKLHPDDRDAVLANYQAHLAGATQLYDAEYRTLAPDGSITWLWDLGRVVERDQQGRPLRIMGAHFDITERKIAEEEMVRLAQSDPLTGLFNRRMMRSQLRMEYSRALRHETPFSIVMLDIDHFKRINDTWGHDVGDRVLIRVAKALTDAVRTEDVCARWGGEEFLLLLPQSDMQQALQVAERVHACLATVTEVIAGVEIGVTASLGLAQFQPEDTEAELLRKADTALLQAKRSGRHCTICWNPS
jgi:diguanylate cyclase (GGDEF)-like protein